MMIASSILNATYIITSSNRHPNVYVSFLKFNFQIYVLKQCVNVSIHLLSTYVINILFLILVGCLPLKKCLIIKFFHMKNIYYIISYKFVFILSSTGYRGRGIVGLCPGR